MDLLGLQHIVERLLQLVHRSTLDKPTHELQLRGCRINPHIVRQFVRLFRLAAENVKVGLAVNAQVPLVHPEQRVVRPTQARVQEVLDHPQTQLVPFPRQYLTHAAGRFRALRIPFQTRRQQYASSA